MEENTISNLINILNGYKEHQPEEINKFYELLKEMLNTLNTNISTNISEINKK